MDIGSYLGGIHITREAIYWPDGSLVCCWVSKVLGIEGEERAKARLHGLATDTDLGQTMTQK